VNAIGPQLHPQAGGERVQGELARAISAHPRNGHQTRD
jgi:hypothetical protein